MYLFVYSVCKKSYFLNLGRTLNLIMNPNKEGITQNFTRNPYVSSSIPTGHKFIQGTEKLDWKVNAIKQIGVELSKNKSFTSLADCYNAASKNLGKI